MDLDSFSIVELLKWATKAKWLRNVLVAGVLLGGPGSFVAYIVVFMAPRTEAESVGSIMAFPVVIPLGIFLWIETNVFPWRYFFVGSLQLLFLLCAGIVTVYDRFSKQKTEDKKIV